LITDAELIRAARSDPDAFGELYRRHAAAVLAYVRARVPASAAGELTAETFAQAALSLRRFRDEAAGSALPWLYGIARNLVRTYFTRSHVERQARRRLGMPLESYELDPDETTERLDAAILAPRISVALGELPAGQRRALELRVVDGLPYEQVAESLGCTPGAARIRVNRALGSLSRLLKGALDGN
jgi:RNA polymerase sigma-70 factor (ECF subfamily)